MARIRIVDAWLRCPTAHPTHQRAVMVVAEAWAEQRVLMRAYADSADQTRPTIALHGAELAIGPAGTDPHGPWGIHVEPPADGRAQRLRDELELAARRLSGSKGNPPRLMDEESPFERKRTNHWAPGTRRDVPDGGPAQYYEPSEAAAAPTPARCFEFRYSNLGFPFRNGRAPARHLYSLTVACYSPLILVGPHREDPSSSTG